MYSVSSSKAITREMGMEFVWTVEKKLKSFILSNDKGYEKEINVGEEITHTSICEYMFLYPSVVVETKRETILFTFKGDKVIRESIPNLNGIKSLCLLYRHNLIDRDDDYYFIGVRDRRFVRGLMRITNTGYKLHVLDESEPFDYDVKIIGYSIDDREKLNIDLIKIMG